MNYQVCWTYGSLPNTMWFAEFFDKKEDAKELYNDKKKCCTVSSVKILTIMGGKDARN